MTLPRSIAMLTTQRLELRQWRETDLAPFAALNADPRVMEFLPKMLTRQESDAMAKRIAAMIERDGFGLWAVEAPGVSEFIGFVGLARPTFGAHFMPCVEIGWRLAYELWGHGYATEAARAVVQFGFEELGLDEILSYTTVANRRSRRVMERLGMTHSPAENFDHPLLAQGHPLRPHVLYRLRRIV